MVSPVDDPTAPPAVPAPRRRGRAGLRPLALALVGAVVGIGAYVLLVERDAPTPAPGTAAAPLPTDAAEPTAAELYEALVPSLVLVRTQAGADGLGSGVVVNEDGQVLTAHHVVAGAGSVELVFADGTRAAATIVEEDPANDLALLAPAQLPEVVVPAVLGGEVRVGDEVYPLGNPFGFSGSLSAGIVSGLERTLLRDDGNGELAGLIQFDAAVNPGSSGGPLIDEAGRVVGIVTALANPTEQRTFVGLGFAVPIATASEVAGTIDR